MGILVLRTSGDCLVCLVIFLGFLMVSRVLFVAFQVIFGPFVALLKGLWAMIFLCFLGFLGKSKCWNHRKLKDVKTPTILYRNTCTYLLMWCLHPSQFETM